MMMLQLTVNWADMNSRGFLDALLGSSVGKKKLKLRSPVQGDPLLVTVKIFRIRLTIARNIDTRKVD